MMMTFLQNIFKIVSGFNNVSLSVCNYPFINRKEQKKIFISSSVQIAHKILKGHITCATRGGGTEHGSRAGAGFLH